MTRVRGAAAVLGALFGFLISWGQFADPDRIRAMLLLEDPYLYLMMGTAVAVGTLGSRLLARRHARALLTGDPVSWERLRPGRRHFAGAALFAVGWALTDSCPAPVAAQVAQGVAWSLFTLTGILVGIEVYLRGQERGAPAVARALRSRSAGADGTTPEPAR